jgi:hypothetical protein
VSVCFSECTVITQLCRKVEAADLNKSVYLKSMRTQCLAPVGRITGSGYAFICIERLWKCNHFVHMQVHDLAAIILSLKYSRSVNTYVWNAKKD